MNNNYKKNCLITKKQKAFNYSKYDKFVLKEFYSNRYIFIILNHMKKKFLLKYS